MIEVPVYNAAGDKLDSLQVDPANFGGEVNKQLLHDAVVMYQANRRSGTHKAKTRGEVAGSKKKMFRQKGTGHARAGSRRSNKRVGGGVAHGPLPRDYSYSMPKKARRLATRMALLSKFQDEEAFIVDGLSLEAPKTKAVADLLKKVGVVEQSCLIATAGVDTFLYLSSRNIDRVEIMPTNELNTLSVLKQKRLMLTRQAFEELLNAGAKSEASTETTSEETGEGGSE